MEFPIKITKTNDSRVGTVDFDNIPFGRVFSDHMFVADYDNGEWGDFRIEPYGPMSFDPAMMALHYGQAIFEGMKAFKNKDGAPVLYRTNNHAKRINLSAERMCMPAFPEDVFQVACETLVGIDHAWIPPKVGSALYMRPFMFATDEFIGVRPSSKYRFVIFTGPVGPYYAKPVNLLASDKYARAIEGGTGEAKAAGNYAASLMPSREANEAGFDQILWLDAKEFKYIQEVGTMNIFFVIGDKVITPATDGAILKGITRDSIIQLLRDRGYDVEERKLSIDEVVEASKNGTLKEVFGSGTAAVVSWVASITYKGYKMELPKPEDCKIGKAAKKAIEDVRWGTIEDKFNWIEPVKVLEGTMA